MLSLSYFCLSLSVLRRTVLAVRRASHSMRCGSWLAWLLGLAWLMGLAWLLGLAWLFGSLSA